MKNIRYVISMSVRMDVTKLRQNAMTDLIVLEVHGDHYLKKMLKFSTTFDYRRNYKSHNTFIPPSVLMFDVFTESKPLYIR